MSTSPELLAHRGGGAPDDPRRPSEEVARVVVHLRHGSPRRSPPVSRGACFGRTCARITDARARSVAPRFVRRSPGLGTLTARKGHSPLRRDSIPCTASTVRQQNDDGPSRRDRRPRPRFTVPRGGTVVPGHGSLSPALGPSSLAKVHCPSRRDRRPRPRDGAHEQNVESSLRRDRRPCRMSSDRCGGTVVRAQCRVIAAEGPSSVRKDDQHRRIARQFRALERTGSQSLAKKALRGGAMFAGMLSPQAPPSIFGPVALPSSPMAMNTGTAASFG